jgi:hypothetical protein
MSPPPKTDESKYEEEEEEEESLLPVLETLVEKMENIQQEIEQLRSIVRTPSVQSDSPALREVQKSTDTLQKNTITLKNTMDRLSQQMGKLQMRCDDLSATIKTQEGMKDTLATLKKSVAIHQISLEDIHTYLQQLESEREAMKKPAEEKKSESEEEPDQNTKKTYEERQRKTLAIITWSPHIANDYRVRQEFASYQLAGQVYHELHRKYTILFWIGDIYGKGGIGYNLYGFITEKHVFRLTITRHHIPQIHVSPIYTFDSPLTTNYIMMLEQFLDEDKYDSMASKIMDGTGREIGRYHFRKSFKESEGWCTNTPPTAHFESLLRYIPGSYKNGDWKQLNGMFGFYLNEKTMELSPMPPPF